MALCPNTFESLHDSVNRDAKWHRWHRLQISQILKSQKTSISCPHRRHIDPMTEMTMRVPIVISVCLCWMRDRNMNSNDYRVISKSDKTVTVTNFPVGWAK